MGLGAPIARLVQSQTQLFFGGQGNLLDSVGGTFPQPITLKFPTGVVDSFSLYHDYLSISNVAAGEGTTTSSYGILCQLQFQLAQVTVGSYLRYLGMSSTQDPSAGGDLVTCDGVLQEVDNSSGGVIQRNDSIPFTLCSSAINFAFGIHQGTNEVLCGTLPLNGFAVPPPFYNGLYVGTPCRYNVQCDTIVLTPQKLIVPLSINNVTGPQNIFTGTWFHMYVSAIGAPDSQ
jgi:hypothetical protein